MKSRVLGWVILFLAFSASGQTQSAFEAQIDNPIYAMSELPDGKILVGGQFNSFNGVARTNLARLNADGTLDSAFTLIANDGVLAWAALTNGQIVIGGSFTNFAGQPRTHLARLNSDWTLDTTFTPTADGDVYSVLQQPDGKIVVAGAFLNLAGQPRNFIGRLNANGTIDASFNPNAGALISVLALQPDGKILAGGNFQSMGGQPCSYICRLNPNGTLDSSFAASADNQVHALALQADSRIIAGGLFQYINGETHIGLARLNSNGTPDSSFTATVRPGYLGDSDTLAIQTDGRILVGGSAVGWFGYPYFARFNSDGSQDTNFTFNISSGVHSIALQRDGRILHATYYTLGRLTNSPATGSLSYSNSTTLVWLRGGAAPEAWRTTFESSTNLTTWLYLGAGARIVGGWQLTGVAVPANARIRARAFITSGYHNASQSFVEAYAGPVTIVGQPASTTNNAGTTATFDVVSDGTQPLTYRWRKNGSNLSDGGNVSGVTNSILTLSNVLHADAASYSVVISNSFGSVTSSVATLSVNDPWITGQPTNQSIDAGQTALFNVAATGTLPLSFRWLKNGTNFPGATNSSLTLSNVQIADPGTAWQAVVTNAFGASTSTVALLTVNGAIADPVNPAPNYPVRSLAIQPDGKILLSGNFSFVGSALTVGIARLNSDGSLDTNFSAGILGIPFSSALPLLALQEDGKMLLAGGISSANGVPRNQIARFNIDGSLDLAFNPGANSDIFAMAFQADGKILLAGTFTNLAGVACNHIGRLNPDGSADTNFSSGVSGTVYSLAVQPDGKIIVGGSFNALGAGSLARTNIGRLNPDGSVEATFNPGTDGIVNALALQADGAILVGGTFSILAGQSRANLGRLGSSGGLDASFNPSVDGAVNSLVIQTDGKIAVGGSFTTLAGQPRHNLGRINANGAIDLTFNPGTDGAISSLALQPDGNLVVGGSFSLLDGQPRANLGRLSSATAAIQNLSYNPSTITWSRSGAGPEVTRVFFDASTNGTTLFRLPGTRIAGGWQANGPGLPANATVRARGWVAGSSDGSSWFVQSTIGPALIERQPVSLTNDPLTSASFEILATGQTPLRFQWVKNGTPLIDNTNLSGALTSRLTINSVLGADAAAYRCAVSNSFGSVTSLVATLTVRDPLVTADPASQALNAGQIATFTASAIGTAPLAWQWLKNGAFLQDGGNIFGANTPTLTVSNALGGDAGSYHAMVTNSWGSATSSVAALTVVDPLLLASPVSQSAQRGQTITFNVSVAGTQPLTWQWRHDGTTIPGATTSSLVLTNVQWTDRGAYDASAANAFGSVTSAVATLTVNLAVADSLNPGANGFVSATAVQTDGKILMGGAFTTLGGQTRSRIGRLNPDGTLDTAFNPGASNNISAIGIQTNGAIVLGGVFTTIAGQPRSYIARLNQDGSLDASLNVPANSFLNSLAIQPDGKILVGGYFTTLNSQPRNYLGRINVDGTLDSTFNPGANGVVFSIAVQTDGKILVGGGFTSLAGQSFTNIGRLNPDGSRDAAFTGFADGAVRVFAEQPDGKIVVGGDFSTLAGQPRSRLGRLNSDGTIDPTLNLGATHALGLQVINTLALEADGRIIVGGNFDHLGGVLRNGLARINPDGMLDPTFTPDAGSVYTLAVQKDGNILVGGYFGSLAAQPRSNLGRLLNSDPPSENIALDSSTITWLRGGTTTEARFTTFEFSTNGIDWLPAGAGSRISGGWQLTGLSLPPNSAIRARSYVVAGSWFVETIAGTAVFASSPVSRTNNAGTTATFSVNAVGGPPLAYHWLRNGLPLSNAGNVSGAQTPVLTLTNVFGADAAAYQVIVSNSYGSVTSQIATLTVVDPLIATQPAGIATNAGAAVTFSVATVATFPVSFQWRKDGANISGATTSALALANAQRADSADYSVVVSNAYGVATSSIATLTLNLAVPDAFNPGANGQVTVLLPQTDGRILVGGSFSSLAGQPRQSLGRLYADGSLDPSFIAISISFIDSVALLPDGRLLVGASIGQRDNFLSVLDSSGVANTNLNLSANGRVFALALQPDGKIVLGGGFNAVNKVNRSGLARLNGDFTLDTNFVTTVSAGSVTCVAAQEDGKILLGGTFSSIGGTNRSRLARLNSDGSVDPAFDPGANNTVNALAVQADGKILVGGVFTTLGGTNRNRMGRLNPDGTPDLTFDPNANNTVNTIAVQTDGGIVVGGAFTTMGGTNRNRIVRLGTNGGVDPWFNPGASAASGGGTVLCLTLQPDGAILVGGNFATLASTPRSNLGRLINPDSASQTLSFNGSTASWLRSGSGPEVWRTTFEVSTNGASWTALGPGARIPSGWQLTGLSLPANANLRARGFAVSGVDNGSSWIAESIIGPPIITLQPMTRTNNAGSVASFYSAASGSVPLGAQWFRNGLPLSNSGNISGAQSPTLTLSNVFGADASSYWVVYGNSFGSVTSLVANLRVVDPIITAQPVSVFTNAGKTAAFSVTAVGTAPAYQWRKNGTLISGASASTLVLVNCQKDDIAGYNVVVSTAYGSVTSSIANLTLNLGLPDSFAPPLDDEVRSLALQPDGKILIGGNFDHYGSDSFFLFGRLNPDGSVDTNFIGHASSSTDTIAMQSDLNILVGGWFNYLNDWPHSYIGRFFPDGNLDPLVNPTIISSTLNPFIDSLVQQPDGKFLMGGWFTSVASQPRNYICRFNADGSLDGGFNPGANTHVIVLALQPDGKIVAGGNFTTLGGQTRNRIGRLNPDGSLDTAFNPGADSTVNALIVQPDGKILVGGSFTSLAGQSRAYLGRLNPDGTLDTSFAPSLNGGVTGFALQADGSVIMGGGFSVVSGQARTGLARISSSGAVDLNWAPQISGGAVGGICIQPDGQILICGSFTNVVGQPRYRLARLSPGLSADHTLLPDANGVTWRRGGASPELSGVRFEISADGTNWSNPGQVIRIAGGWRVDASSLTIGTIVRARGFAAGGRWNGSLSLIEENAQVSGQTPPVILSGDSTFGYHTNAFSFTVRALAGQTIIIEASTDFLSWTPLQTNVMTNPPQILFADSAHLPYRFYRPRVF